MSDLAATAAPPRRAARRRLADHESRDRRASRRFPCSTTRPGSGYDVLCVVPFWASSLCCASSQWRRSLVPPGGNPALYGTRTPMTVLLRGNACSKENARMPPMLPMVGRWPIIPHGQGCARAHRHRSDPRPRSRPAAAQCRCRMMTATEYRTMWTATEYRTRREPPPELPEPPPVSPVKLVDAVTGDYIRDPEPWEITEIGDKEFAIDSYSYVPDKTLILTFDDGPDPIWTPKILDVLARENVPATFFVIGERVVKNPEIVQRMVREGHELGNHSLTHPDLQNLPDLQRQEELVVTDRILRAVAGYDTPLFRMPMGAPSENPLTQLHSQQLGYIEVDQTLDSHDWEHAGPGDVVPMPVLDGHGYVVTMHDAGGHTRVNTVTFLEKFIAQAKAQGYTFTTVSSLFPQTASRRKTSNPHWWIALRCSSRRSGTSPLASSPTGCSRSSS